MFPIDSPMNQNAALIMRYSQGYVPFVVTSSKDELLACRRGAWLGLCLCGSPVYDISGPDCVKLLNYATVNRDYGTLKVGKSRHALFCNDKGQMLADSVLMRWDENTYRSYWLAPALSYYVDTMDFDVQGQWVLDECFFQIDGPKSLQIAEKVTHADLHDLKFAQNKAATIADIPVTVHRLGMSGCLAYEVHGPRDDAGTIYDAICTAGEEFGIKRLGFVNYCRNHTPGGYPNQFIHYWYPYLSSGEKMKEYFANQPMTKALSGRYPFSGSASDDVQNAFVTPFDVGWESLISYDHDFVGKDALQKLGENPPRKVVTLEWNADDIGSVFASQFRGKGTAVGDDIDQVGDGGGTPFIISKVLADGKMIGVASGRTRDYYDQRMLSLAFIDKAYAQEGREFTVKWGTNPETAMDIRATVAEFPYYNEEYRNETFDVEKIPHPTF